MSIEEAAELARRSIYHATFRDGASGGTASGKLSPSPLGLSLFLIFLFLLLEHKYLSNFGAIYQFIMLVLMDGRNCLVMMLENCTTSTILSDQLL